MLKAEMLAKQCALAREAEIREGRWREDARRLYPLLAEVFLLVQATCEGESRSVIYYAPSLGEKIAEALTKHADLEREMEAP